MDDKTQDIDLGEDPEELNSAPTNGSENATPSYPTVILSGGPSLHKIPDTGHLTFKHKVVAKHMPRAHSKHHRIEIELHSLKESKTPRKHSNFQANDGKRIKKLLEDVPA